MSAVRAATLSTVIQSRRAAVATLAAILAVSALLMLPTFDSPAAEDEEGVAVTFPARLLHGELTHRDYYDPYGPAGAWVVAAADEVFGTSVDTERAVGVVFRLSIVA